MPWSPNFVLGLPSNRCFLKIIQMIMKPWKKSWRLYVHFVFTYSMVPQAWCEAKLDWLRLSHQWECLKCHGHGPSVSCVKWPLVQVCGKEDWTMEHESLGIHFWKLSSIKNRKSRKKERKKVVCRSFHCSVSYINWSGVIVKQDQMPVPFPRSVGPYQ